MKTDQTDSTDQKPILTVWKPGSPEAHMIPLSPAGGYGYNVDHVLPSPDESFIIIHTDNVASCFDLPDGKRRWSRRLIFETGIVSFIDANSRYVFCPSSNLILVHDARTGATLGRLIAHSEAVKFIVASPRVGRFVSFSLDGMVNVWNAEKLEIERSIQSFPGGDYLPAAAISSDGNVLAFGTPSGLFIYDLNSGELLGEVRRPEDGLGQIALSSDGFRLAGVHQGAVSVWDLSPLMRR
jgi:WD40 repeat protein